MKQCTLGNVSHPHFTVHILPWQRSHAIMQEQQRCGVKTRGGVWGRGNVSMWKQMGGATPVRGIRGKRVISWLPVGHAFGPQSDW